MGKMLGHVERLSSVESEEIVMLPRPLSTEEVKKLLEQCDERFIKLNVQRIIQAEVITTNLHYVYVCVNVKCSTF